MKKNLINQTQIASKLGVTRQRVHKIIESDITFPAPYIAHSAISLWDAAEISQWVARYNQRPQRERRLKIMKYIITTAQAPDYEEEDWGRTVLEYDDGEFVAYLDGDVNDWSCDTVIDKAVDALGVDIDRVHVYPDGPNVYGARGPHNTATTSDCWIVEVR